jgi:hypothetical protein
MRIRTQESTECGSNADSDPKHGSIARVFQSLSTPNFPKNRLTKFGHLSNTVLQKTFSHLLCCTSVAMMIHYYYRYITFCSFPIKILRKIPVPVQTMMFFPLQIIAQLFPGLFVPDSVIFWPQIIIINFFSAIDIGILGTFFELLIRKFGRRATVIFALFFYLTYCFFPVLLRCQRRTKTWKIIFYPPKIHQVCILKFFK